MAIEKALIRISVIKFTVHIGSIATLCASIDYCIFSFIGFKLTLIGFTKTVVNDGLFFQKNLL